jgi:hypothetical protein
MAKIKAKSRKAATVVEEPDVPEISFAVYLGDYGDKDLQHAVDTVEQCIRAVQHAANTGKPLKLTPYQDACLDKFAEALDEYSSELDCEEEEDNDG